MIKRSFSKKELCSLAVVVVILLLIGFTVCKAADLPKVKELKWAVFFPAADYNSPTLKKFRDDIEAFTNGSIKPRLYWVGQIAETKDLPDLCRTGAVEMTTTAPSYYPSTFPLNATLQTFPWVFKNPEQAVYAWRGLLRDFPEIQGEYAKQNQYCLNRSALAPYDTLSKKPLRNLADLKGLKIRVTGKRFSKLMEKAGAVPIFIAAAELYEALMKGTIDAVMLTLQTFESLKFYESAKYVSLRIGCVPGFYTTINLDVWNSFTPEIKKAFARAANEYGVRDLELQLTTGNKTMESLKKKGVQFIEFDQKDWKTLISMAGDPWVDAKEDLIKDMKVDAAVADRFTKRWHELTVEYEQRYLSTGKKWEYR